MQDNSQITARFFTALEILIANKQIRGKQTFCRRYDINRRNLYQLERDPSRKIFQPAWLSHLVIDFGFSADWLLTGNEPKFSSKNANEMQMKNGSL